MNEQAVLPIGNIAVIDDPNPMVIRHGRGPEGARCRTCRRTVPSRFGSARTYWKCERRGITHGQGTDHRLKWNACRLYEVDTP